MRCSALFLSLSLSLSVDIYVYIPSLPFPPDPPHPLFRFIASCLFVTLFSPKAAPSQAAGMQICGNEERLALYKAGVGPFGTSSVEKTEKSDEGIGGKRHGNGQVLATKNHVLLPCLATCEWSTTHHQATLLPAAAAMGTQGPGHRIQSEGASSFSNRSNILPHIPA